MMLGLDTFIDSLRTGIRMADLVDILLVAAALYAGIGWFRTARSRFVILGLGTLVVLYFVASLLRMRLTLFLFHAGITIALVALVVIFQEDIRRGFERLATGGWFRLRQAPPPSVDTLVEAVSELARQRAGALLVLKGREPLERHINGGVPLDGKLSPALLFSIFDASSPGHDGAVVVDQGKVRRFGVHLPLSRQSTLDGGRGTRHSAALGLSERSDALVVVVSEERGTIGIAEAGSLQTVDATGLRTRLQRFFADVASQRQSAPARRLRPMLTRNLGLKAASVAAASLAWLVLFGHQREIVARTYTVPVIYRNLPPGWLLEEPSPLEARVTLSGPSADFASLEPASLAISLDVGSVKRGAQLLPLHGQDVGPMGALSVHQVEPRSARVVAHPTVEVSLPIEPRLEGQPPRGLRLKGTQTDPPEIRIHVRADWRHRYRRVLTEPVDLSQIHESTTLPVRLLIPEGARPEPSSSAEARLSLRMAEPAKKAKSKPDSNTARHGAPAQSASGG